MRFKSCSAPLPKANPWEGHGSRRKTHWAKSLACGCGPTKRGKYATPSAALDRLNPNGCETPLSRQSEKNEAPEDSLFLSGTPRPHGTTPRRGKSAYVVFQSSGRNGERTMSAASCYRDSLPSESGVRNFRSISFRSASRWFNAT